MAVNIADVACCILRAAESTLDAFGYLPTYRYVAAKGGADWECCSTLVVAPLESTLYVSNDPKCGRLRSYRFSVEVGVCVNEAWRCVDVGGCCDVPERFDPCGDGFPSKSAESRFLLGLRHVLERGAFIDAVRCCLREGVTCDGSPMSLTCRALDVGTVQTVAEGGCFMVLAEIVAVF